MSMQDELRRVSFAVADLLSAMMEARFAAEDYRLNASSACAQTFLDSIYEIEDRVWGLNPIGDAGYEFSAINSQPIVGISPVPEPSVHGAIVSLGRSIGCVADAVLLSAFPDAHEPGVEYLLPRLCKADELLPHIKVAIASYIEHFPSLDDLNRFSVLREQELARAIRSARNGLLEQTTPDTPDTASDTPKKTGIPQGWNAKFLLVLKRLNSKGALQFGDITRIAEEFKRDNPACLVKTDSLAKAATRYPEHWKTDT